MINLIPNEEKKRITRDFYLRLLAVFFAMLAAAVFLGSISMLPAYFMSVEYKNLEKDKLAQQANMPGRVLDEGAKEKVREIDTKLLLIESVEQDKFIVSREILNELLKEITHEIRVSGIAYSSSDGSGKSVTLSGVAMSREGLLKFQQSLKNNKSFKSIELPISNFIKDADIPFTISLIPSK